MHAELLKNGDMRCCTVYRTAFASSSNHAKYCPDCRKCIPSETGCRMYAEKTRPYYAIEGKTFLFTRRFGRISCMGKELIPNLLHNIQSKLHSIFLIVFILICNKYLDSFGVFSKILCLLFVPHLYLRFGYICHFIIKSCVNKWG